MPTQDKAVTTRERNLPVVPEGYTENFPEGYDETDHVLPVMSIIQPTSGPDKKALGEEGQFVARDGTAYDALHFVLMSVGYPRGIKDEYQGPNAEGSMWLCYSDQRRLGYPKDVKAVFGDKDPDFQYDEQGREVIECRKCPHFADEKNWVKPEDGGCRYGNILRGWDLEANRPFAYFVSGSAVSPIRAAIIDRVTPRKGANGQLFVEKLFWWAELELTTTMKQGKGAYYVPVVRIVKELSAEEQAKYASRYGTVREAKIEEPTADDPQQAALGDT